MAALATITAVRPTSDTVTRLVQYGVTVAAGQCVYLDSADNKYKLADANLSLAAAAALGVAVTPGIADGYGIVATAGSIILVGTTAVVGESYFVGGTGGEIVPSADVTTGFYVTRLGTASSATQLLLSVSASGVVRA